MGKRRIDDFFEAIKVFNDSKTLIECDHLKSKNPKKGVCYVFM